MKSPFPGMDPYLEHPAYRSEDFHSRFINAWCEAIADALPPQYEATLGERVYLVEHIPEARKLGFPDVAVSHGERPTPSSQSPASTGATETLEPVTIPLTILEGPRETYIEILYQPERSLVAALELLSPPPSPYPLPLAGEEGRVRGEAPGRTEYLAKRRALLVQNVHLAELDLLFGGRRLPLQQALPSADYYYLLSRGDQRPDCQVYRWTVRQPLPTLPVPLRSPDADLHIDLAAVFATAYERGRFFRRLNYQGPVPAFLREDNRRWCEAIVRQE
jgi:hypothetical protein